MIIIIEDSEMYPQHNQAHWNYGAHRNINKHYTKCCCYDSECKRLCRNSQSPNSHPILHYTTPKNTVLGSDRNFGSAKNFAELFVIQFHAHLQYMGIKRTDYVILCNKSFSQSQQNSTIHISTTPFYVVKLSACCGEEFYVHALILVLSKLYMLRLSFFET